MTPRFFMSYILVNIFRILMNLFETLIPFFRKTSVIAAATLIIQLKVLLEDLQRGFPVISTFSNLSYILYTPKTPPILLITLYGKPLCTVVWQNKPDPPNLTIPTIEYWFPICLIQLLNI